MGPVGPFISVERAMKSSPAPMVARRAEGLLYEGEASTVFRGTASR